MFCTGPDGFITGILRNGPRAGPGLVLGSHTAAVAHIVGVVVVVVVVTGRTV